MISDGEKSKRIFHERPTINSRASPWWNLGLNLSQEMTDAQIQEMVAVAVRVAKEVDRQTQELTQRFKKNG